MRISAMASGGVGGVCLRARFAAGDDNDNGSWYLLVFGVITMLPVSIQKIVATI